MDGSIRSTRELTETDSLLQLQQQMIVRTILLKLMAEACNSKSKLKKQVSWRRMDGWLGAFTSTMKRLIVMIRREQFIVYFCSSKV